MCNIYLAEGNVVRRLRLYCPRAKMSDASLPARAQCSPSSVFFTVIILSSDKDLGELVDKTRLSLSNYMYFKLERALLIRSVENYCIVSSPVQLLIQKLFWASDEGFKLASYDAPQTRYLHDIKTKRVIR